MRSAVIGFATVFAIGLIALAAVGLGQRSSLVYSLGVTPAHPAAGLRTGDRARARRRSASRAAPRFDRVDFMLRRFADPGPPVRIEVPQAPTRTAGSRPAASSRATPTSTPRARARTWSRSAAWRRTHHCSCAWSTRAPAPCR